MIILTGISGTLGSLLAESLLAKYPDTEMLGVCRNIEKVPLHLKEHPRLTLREFDLSKPTYSSIGIHNVVRNKKVKLLINCAGVCHNVSLEKIEIADVVDQVNVNLTSCIAITKCLLPLMEKSSKIVNISSLLGRIPSKNYSVYCATKFGLVGFSESLRIELKPKGIKVYCILPNYFSSSMTENIPKEDWIIPHKPKELSNQIVKILDKSDGVKTIGIQAHIGCLLERFSPLANRLLTSFGKQIKCK